MKNSQNSLSYFQLQTHAEEEEEEETKRKLRCLKTSRRIYIYKYIFFAFFQKIKLPFTCWFPPAKSHQRERDWSRRVCAVEIRTTVSPRMNFQRRSASRLFILSAAIVNRLIYASAFFFLFLPEQRAQLHPLQADESYITWMRTCAGEPYLPLGTAGRLFFFLQTHQQPFNTTDQTLGCFHSEPKWLEILLKVREHGQY